jgi:hypothetical protein
MRAPNPGGWVIGGALAMTVAMWSLIALSSGGIVFAQTPTSGASEAYFNRMFVVLQHPRCMNCHTGEAFPRQGDDHHPHTMNVMRGPEDRGAAGLHCGSCHQSTNQMASGVPGAPDWHLAPLRMAWAGLSAGQLCRALRDPARGGMRPDQMLAHFNTGLVRWAWEPGRNAGAIPRATPSLSFDEFVTVTKLWVESGAVCPE